MFLRTHNNVARDLGSSVSARHPIHVSCACVSDLSSTLHFALFTVSVIFVFILLIFIFYVGRFGVKPLRASANDEEPSPLVNNAPLTGYEPKIFDDYHFSETTEIFIQESSSDSKPSNLHGWEISDYTIGRALFTNVYSRARRTSGP